MKLHVVLVRSEYSSNIGASARAAANMGADSMILIAPTCELDLAARQAAAGAADFLATARTHASWTDFLATEPDGLRIAMTRRSGKQRKVFPLTEKLSSLKDDIQNHMLNNLYFIFGPEADGLDAEDLAWVNCSCALPTYGEFSSLNLAQAVLLTLAFTRDRFADVSAKANPIANDDLDGRPFYFPDDLIKEWLTTMGFNISARKASAYLTLRRLFLQNLPTKHEIQVLEAILQQNIRKLKGQSVDLTTKDLADDFGDITSK